jgi:AcrR family transcriptional regulator
MPNEESLTLADIERETDRFLMPATEKESDILRAAVDLLGERGVDGATTAEIAKRAGVTERTLFRYFPSKRDLVRRVLAPTILHTILTREWRPFGALLDGSAADGGERPTFVSERFAGIATNPPVARALFGELTRNAELRNDLARLWRRHFWNPMLTTVRQLKTNDALRKDVDPEALVWAIDCLNIGYLFLRSIHAADRKWDDAKELEKIRKSVQHQPHARLKEQPMTAKVEDLLPTAKELLEQIALAEAEKAAESMRKRAEAEAEKKRLLDTFSKPSLSDEEAIRQGIAIIQRAAKNGQTEVQVFRFPNELCTDHGRAINQTEPGWEGTLTGVPKQIYQLWNTYLRPRGYKLRVQIVDWPDGMPGDIAMTLSWQ